MSTSTKTPVDQAAMTRSDAAKVRAYLEAISTPGKRGRKRTPERMQERLEQIEHELHDASPLQRIQLIQEKLDLSKALEQSGDRVDVDELREAFVKVASRWSETKGITYSAWREAGVTPEVLKEAGISRK